MTAPIDHSTKLMRQLISCCQKAQRNFQSAAAAVDDRDLKRLFEIYARQRARFADELHQYVSEPETEKCEFGDSVDENTPRSEWEMLRECELNERLSQALYRETLAQRALPTRAQFTITAQLALMERVHARMAGILGQTDPTRTRAFNGERARA